MTIQMCCTKLYVMKINGICYQATGSKTIRCHIEVDRQYDIWKQEWPVHTIVTKGYQVPTCCLQFSPLMPLLQSLYLISAEQNSNAQRLMTLTGNRCLTSSSFKFFLIVNNQLQSLQHLSVISSTLTDLIPFTSPLWLRPLIPSPQVLLSFIGIIWGNVT